MKRGTILIAQAILLTIFLSSCASASGSAPAADAVVPSDQANYFWQLDILHAETSEDLAATQTFILYGGSTEDVQYAKTASAGNTFLLLELSVDKNGVGGSPFSWADLYVEDGAGNHYYRMDNDVFLEDYDLPRLKSTDLTIGNNTGYICLEIPADVDVSSLKLVHEAEEGLNILPISFE